MKGLLKSILFILDFWFSKKYLNSLENSKYSYPRQIKTKTKTQDINKDRPFPGT